MSLRISYKKDIEEILADNDLSAKDKLDRLYEYRTAVFDAIEEKVNEIESDYIFCPKCQDYYKSEFFRQFERKEKRKFCTNKLMGYLEPYEWEDREVYVKYEECPKGHLIEI